MIAHVDDVHASVPALIQVVADEAIEIAAVEQAQTSLDDVFLRYTGRRPQVEAPTVRAVSGLFAAAHARHLTGMP